MEKHLAIEKENSDGRETITKSYIDYLETQLRLVKEAYEAGIVDKTEVKE